MTVTAGNLLAAIPPDRENESVESLMTAGNLRIERIVSQGQASPPGFWYDQDWAEWVLVVAGEARLQIEAEPSPRHLRPGEYVLIPAHVRHRVEWTAADGPTIWLAVHYQ